MTTNPTNPSAKGPGITRISVTGFKSLATKTDVEIRPLTVLAGANSSGKSSLMQPLLMLKQTLEAQFDPGALLIDGAHVKFTSTSQFLSKPVVTSIPSRSMTVGIDIGTDCTKLTFQKAAGRPIEVEEMDRSGYNNVHCYAWSTQIRADDSSQALREVLRKVWPRDTGLLRDKEVEFVVVSDRCFLRVRYRRYSEARGEGQPWQALNFPSDECAKEEILRVIHLPGLHGLPERTYPLVPVGNIFPGLFQNYASSVIHAWVKKHDVESLKRLNDALDQLELQSDISVDEVNEAQIGLSVSRSKQGRGGDRVSIADVGLAVSQVLPVLIAITVAQAGQLIYVEQPEIHLHPRAQWRLAKLLAEAANRGVKLVIETHSSLLLRGILTQIAENKIANDKVILHWFERHNETGISSVHTKEPDSAGRVGDWPEDFSDVELKSDNEYLDAVDKKLYAEAK